MNLTTLILNQRSGEFNESEISNGKDKFNKNTEKK